jgi:predicted DNA-binding protein
MQIKPLREEASFNLKLPPPLRERARVEADNAGMSLALYIRTLIEEDVKRRQHLGPAHMVIMSLVSRLPYDVTERALIEAKGK